MVWFIYFIKCLFLYAEDPVVEPLILRWEPNPQVRLFIVKKLDYMNFSFEFQHNIHIYAFCDRALLTCLNAYCE
jgi:hypothetical protein